MSIEYFAKYSGCITLCTKKSWKKQEACEFSEKSKYRDCCEDYMDINGGICKNIDAQKLAAVEK